jgi:nitrogen regulatory protein P-II 1
MTKVEVVVIRERVETVIDAVEEETGHVGVTVIEAVGHGKQRGVTHEYRGRVFESRFLPKALLVFIVADESVDAVVAAAKAAAVSGNESGDGLVWTTPVANVTHSRTGKVLTEAEGGACSHTEHKRHLRLSQPGSGRARDAERGGADRVPALRQADPPTTRPGAARAGREVVSTHVDRGVQWYQRIERLDVRDRHADAAVRRGRADRADVVGPVNAGAGPEAHPA